MSKVVWVIVGVVGAAGIGVLLLGKRKYACAPPSAEARNTLGAIARAVQASYEGRPALFTKASEPSSRRGLLCGSAESVPGEIPRPDQRYKPTDSDYVGTSASGWQCLGFELTQPHRFRYSYHAGTGYLGPSRGLPDPGPRGFEAAAEARCEDGTTTVLFTVIGRVEEDGTLNVVRSVNSSLADPDKCLAAEAGNIVSGEQTHACR